EQARQLGLLVQLRRIALAGLIRDALDVGAGHHAARESLLAPPSIDKEVARDGREIGAEGTYPVVALARFGTESAQEGLLDDDLDLVLEQRFAKPRGLPLHLHHHAGARGAS